MKLFPTSKHFFTVALMVILACGGTQNIFCQQKNADSLRIALRKDPKNLKLNSLLYDALKKISDDSASRFIDKMLIAGEDKNDSVLISEAYNFKATLVFDQGKTNESVLFYKKALAYIQSKQDSASLSLNGTINKNLAYALSKGGEFKESEPYFNKAIDLFGKIKDSLGIAETYLRYGQLLKDLGSYDKAALLLFQGLGIAERRNDDKLIGKLMNNIANVYNGMGKYDDAINFYKQSIDYKIKSGQTGEIGNTYGNIGVTYYSLKKFDLALTFYRKALPLKLQNNDKRGAATTINNIGLAFFEMKQYDSSEVYLLSSLKMREEFADELGIASSNASLGNLYVKMNQPAKAIPYLESATKLADKNGALEILSRAYLYSSFAYNALGKYKEAYDCSKKYIDVSDSLLKQENLKQSEEMKAKYESVKQEEKIKDMQNQQIQDQLKRDADEAEQKQNKYILIAVGIIAMIIAWQSYVRQRDQKKSQKVLQTAYNEIETKNKNITDSIRYAQRIQRSILPDPIEFKRLFKNSFVLYKPKDIVSGDFWWIHETPDKEMVIAVADCTGHGVPGAFMSVMGTDILAQATKNKTINNCEAALHFLDQGVRAQLKQTGGDDESRDGMDIAIMMIDLKNKKAQFAGALRPLVIVREGKLIEYPASRFSIGGAFSGEKKFVNHDIEIQSGDMIYLFTDGFGDQFGGPNGKKYKTAKLKELLVSIANLSPEEQSAKLENAFNKWKGDLEQVDDICVAGIRV
jgi:serine phosphatase RsbU (regulator of sigma subunit)